MPHFVNKKRDYIITTSFKCGYSTLNRNDNLIKISSRELLEYKKKRNNYHYMVCRNPYNRVESLFKDKFRKLPMKDDFHLQDFHKKLKNKLNLNLVEKMRACSK